jgi:hypothetical protein
VDSIAEVKELAERDLWSFIRLVSPKRHLGALHRELIDWWTRSEAKSHQLTLLPRGHMKSALVAYRAAWEITRNPAVTIFYISSTAALAEKQLKAIKDILTSPGYRRYWPEMVAKEEGKRELWNSSEISIDHPKRKEEQVRDPTVFTGGLTTGRTGFHCDIAILDDTVVQENAYTEDGRGRVEGQYSQLSSIENPGAKEWVVGTRYHPKDLYARLIDMAEDIFDENGDVTGSEEVYEVFERQVEDKGDGSGEFIWPRTQREDGQWFGFSQTILAKKKAQYLDKTQFYAQYYNNPNIGDDSGIRQDRFQYYDKNMVTRRNGIWYVRGLQINVFASIDFAFSLNKRADYSCVVVVGIDEPGNIYVLDINRYRTEKLTDHFNVIRDLHIKWNFRKLRAETTVAQSAIVRELKDQYFKPHGLALSIDEFNPSRHLGSKEERIHALLYPRYDNQTIWHYHGGNCSLLEEELMQAHPAHDDIKDALASAIDVAIPPRRMRLGNQENMIEKYNKLNSRFGGI